MRQPATRPVPWKDVAVLVLTAAAFAFSLSMFAQWAGWSSPGMALMLFLCFLGLARFAEPVYRLKLPGALRTVRSWELQGHLYRVLRVPAFGRLLRDTPLRLLNPSVYLSRDRSDPATIRPQVESAEAIHFWAAILLLPYMFVCAATRSWGVLASFVALQAIGNAYPIMHLRSVRGRLERLEQRSRR